MVFGGIEHGRTLSFRLSHRKKRSLGGRIAVIVAAHDRGHRGSRRFRHRRAVESHRGAARGRAGAWRASAPVPQLRRSEEHASELQSLMRISYAVFCLKKKKTIETVT